MGRVFFRSRQLRAAVILLILLGVGLLPGVAKATTPPSGTVPTSGNKPILFTAPNCDALNGGNPSSIFCMPTGGLNPTTSPTTGDCSPIDPNPTPMNPCPVGTSPTACPLQPYDSINSICEHFELTVAQSGTVSVCITFPDGSGFNAVDIFAVPVTGFAATDQAVGVAADTTTSTGPTPGPTPGTLQQCTGNFSAAAGTFFDIQLNPTFLIGGIMTGQISGTINFTSGGGTASSTPGPIGPKFSGGGQLSDGANLSLNVTNTVLTTGKVRFKLSPTCSVASTSFTLVDVEGSGSIPGGLGSNGTAHVKGSGHDMNGNGVEFEIQRAADNGEGSSQSTRDQFDITITNASGPVCTEPLGTSLQNGNLQYHP